jgi:hypothetical protein
MPTKSAKVCALPKKILRSAVRRPVVSTAAGRIKASNILMHIKSAKTIALEQRNFALEKFTFQSSPLWCDQVLPLAGCGKTLPDGSRRAAAKNPAQPIRHDRSIRSVPLRGAGMNILPLLWPMLPEHPSLPGSLQTKQLLGIATSDFETVRFADGSVVEPVRCFGHVLERIINGEQYMVGSIEDQIPELVGVKTVACGRGRQYGNARTRSGHRIDIYNSSREMSGAISGEARATAFGPAEV